MYDKFKKEFEEKRREEEKIETIRNIFRKEIEELKKRDKEKKEESKEIEERIKKNKENVDKVFRHINKIFKYGKEVKERMEKTNTINSTLKENVDIKINFEEEKERIEQEENIKTYKLIKQGRQMKKKEIRKGIEEILEKEKTRKVEEDNIWNKDKQDGCIDALKMLLYRSLIF